MKKESFPLLITIHYILNFSSIIGKKCKNA
jgi:hypothetical protein